MRRLLISAVAATILCLVPAASYAQLNGQDALGDFGVGSGTQPAPGAYVGLMYYRYSTDTIKKADGSRLTFAPDDPGSLSLQAFAPVLVFVTKAKILGAHCGFMVSPSFANAALAAPGFGLGQDVGTGTGDTYIVPITLGWHGKRADSTVAFGVFVPTGRYEANADDNIGRGMWSYELSAGTTVFFDEVKTWSFAAAGYWETHMRKEGTGFTLPNGTVLTSGITVGDIFTLAAARRQSPRGSNLAVTWRSTDGAFEAADGSNIGDDSARRGLPPHVETGRWRLPGFPLGRPSAPSRRDANFRAQ